MVTDKKIKLRSRINKFFTPELQRELEQMIFYEYGRDNNAKATKKGTTFISCAFPIIYSSMSC